MAGKERILVVDDDLNTLKMVEQLLTLKKYEVTTCLTARDALREMGSGGFSAAVIDYFMPDCTGMEIMKALHKEDRDLPVIILTASRDVKIAVEMIQQGAFNYLVKPVDPDDLYINLDNALKNRRLAIENRRLKLDLKERYKFDQIIGSSGGMMDVFDMVTRASGVRSTVLVMGETGAGKELVARAIHFNSDRAGGPFIRVNCSALAESILEAELFGIEKHVATGVDARMGKFEAAGGGTIFLDEIGDMALPAQAKVLRAIQEREIERVGSNTPRKVDFRLIAATNRDLSADIKEKLFREDLFYRLNVLVICLPPLRERRADIMALTEHFLIKHCEGNNMQLKKISPDALARLMNYQWPGNVRELENSIERAVVMCDGQTVGVSDLPDYLMDNHHAPEDCPPQHGGNGSNLDEMVNNYERDLIICALEKNDWKQNKTAESLGVSERSMWYKIKKLGIKISR